jgi:hypothetical protein
MKDMKETANQFKARKRRELKAVIQAFAVFRCGCGATPGYSYFTANQINDALLVWKKQLSTNVGWGRG